MSRLPLRLRLALVFAAATAAVLSGAGWFVYHSVASDLSRALDQELRARAQDLSTLVAHGGLLRASRGGLIESGESFAELVARDGRVLDATAPIGTRRLISSTQVGRALRAPLFTNRSSAPGLDEPARLLAVPLQRKDRPLVLVVGTTRENRAETLRSLLTAFFIGGPLALILTSVGGYAVAGAALRPIEAMRRRAEEISSSSLDERLPVPLVADEISRLGETLNRMLARIEDGVARERNFVTDASHELRTPLALLKTELELALRQERSATELEQALRSAAAETDRLGRIANDLLLLARSENGRLPLRLEAVDLAEVLETVRGRFASRVDANGRVISVETNAARVVTADRLRLEQAREHGRQRGALRRRPDYARIRSARRLSGGARRDEGQGFPPAFLGRAFERFSRGDDVRSTSGSGLGLAIVAAVALAHGGTAHAANRSDGGADVWMVLPLK